MRWPWTWPSRMHAELARLRESEARYRLLAEHARDVIVQYDAAGIVQYVSPSIVAFGRQPEAMIGRHVLEYAHPEDVAIVKQRLALLGEGHALPPEDGAQMRFRHGDGGWLWVQGSPTPVFDAQGQPAGVITILRDVTEQRGLEAQLRESEQRYRQLADNASDVIARFDMTGRIEFISRSVSAFGYTPEEMIGRRSTDFVHPDDRTGNVRAAIRSGQAIPAGEKNEFRMRRADGTWAWVQGSPAVIRDDTGEAVAVVTVLRDVTEQRRLEDELRRKEAEAQAAVAAKSEFLANMSHEIRTPLTAVIGFAGLLAKMAGLPDRGRVYAERIARSGEALTSIVNNVLDFSKIEAGQVVLKAEPFELSAFAEELLGVLEDEAKAKGLTLTAEVRGAAGPLLADAGRLRQVALNLLANAVKFTHRGEVALLLSHEGGILHAAVRDSGIGIAPEFADRLFQRFSQVDSSNARRFGGAGLGLAISRGLVDLMGGEIGVDSVEGQGSTFWFRVAAPAAASVTAPAEPDYARPSAGARVLVVDDARANRELILALLSPFELQLTEAADGLEALEAARRAPFDLVLMDLQMPGMDGMAAARAIRGGELNARTPIVAVSASVQPSDVEACRRAGMDDHIPKPIDPRELLGKIARWTDVGLRPSC